MRKARILVVDDEIGAARLLKSNLELTGRYEVLVENWPEDALERAIEFKPDLLLLDLIMPRLPGGNVAAAVEEDARLKDVRVVYFTAAVWPGQVEDNDGWISDHRCLAKPASVDKIIAFIEENLPEAVRAELYPANPS